MDFTKIKDYTKNSRIKGVSEKIIEVARNKYLRFLNEDKKYIEDLNKTLQNDINKYYNEKLELLNEQRLELTKLKSNMNSELSSMYNSSSQLKNLIYKEDLKTLLEFRLKEYKTLLDKKSIKYKVLTNLPDTQEADFNTIYFLMETSENFKEFVYDGSKFIELKNNYKIDYSDYINRINDSIEKLEELTEYYKQQNVLSKSNYDAYKVEIVDSNKIKINSNDKVGLFSINTFEHKLENNIIVDNYESYNTDTINFDNYIDKFEVCKPDNGNEELFIAQVESNGTLKDETYIKRNISKNFILDNSIQNFILYNNYLGIDESVDIYTNEKIINNSYEKYLFNITLNTDISNTSSSIFFTNEYAQETNEVLELANILHNVSEEILFLTTNRKLYSYTINNAIDFPYQWNIKNPLYTNTYSDILFDINKYSVDGGNTYINFDLDSKIKQNVNEKIESIWNNQTVTLPKRINGIKTINVIGDKLVYTNKNTGSLKEISVKAPYSNTSTLETETKIAGNYVISSIKTSKETDKRNIVNTFYLKTSNRQKVLYDLPIDANGEIGGVNLISNTDKDFNIDSSSSLIDIGNDIIVSGYINLKTIRYSNRQYTTEKISDIKLTVNSNLVNINNVNGYFEIILDYHNLSKITLQSDKNIEIYNFKIEVYDGITQNLLYNTFDIFTEYTRNEDNIYIPSNEVNTTKTIGVEDNKLLFYRTDSSEPYFEYAFDELYNELGDYIKSNGNIPKYQKAKSITESDDTISIKFDTKFIKNNAIVEPFQVNLKHLVYNKTEKDDVEIHDDFNISIEDTLITYETGMLILDANDDTVNYQTLELEDFEYELDEIHELDSIVEDITINIPEKITWTNKIGYDILSENENDDYEIRNIYTANKNNDKQYTNVTYTSYKPIIQGVRETYESSEIGKPFKKISLATNKKDEQNRDITYDYTVYNAGVYGNYPQVTGTESIIGYNIQTDFTDDILDISKYFSGKCLKEEIKNLHIHNDLAISIILVVSYKNDITDKNKTITEFKTLHPNEYLKIDNIFGFVWYVYKIGEIESETALKQEESESWII